MRRIVSTSVIGVLLIGVATTGIAVGMPTARAEVSNCRSWSRSVVASGLGVAENLAFDGRGSLLVSAQTLAGAGGSVKAIRRGGHARTVLSGVSGPAGIVATTDGVYVAVGSTAESGLLNRRDGSVVRLDESGGKGQVVARGMTQPNGLAILPDGRFVTSRDIGTSTGLSVTDPATGTVKRFGPRGLTSTNGLALNRAGSRLYISSTFTGTSTITAVDVRNPNSRVGTYAIPGFGPANAADGLTVGSDGNLYIALNAAGRIIKIDPRTGANCTIADNLPLTSSVRFGAGTGWDPASLYATSFLGTVTRLRPHP